MSEQTGKICILFQTTILDKSPWDSLKLLQVFANNSVFNTLKGHIYANWRLPSPLVNVASKKCTFSPADSTLRGGGERGKSKRGKSKRDDTLWGTYQYDLYVGITPPPPPPPPHMPECEAKRSRNWFFADLFILGIPIQMELKKYEIKEFTLVSLSYSYSFSDSHTPAQCSCQNEVVRRT